MTMKKLVVIIIVLPMLAASFYAGMRCGRILAVTEETVFNAKLKVAALLPLRDGDTPLAIALLEDILDRNTVTLDRWIKSPLSRSSRAQITQTLQRIAYYRQCYPRIPEAILDVSSTTNPAIREGLTLHNDFNAAMNVDIERIINDPAYSLEKSDK